MAQNMVFTFLFNFRWGRLWWRKRIYEGLCCLTTSTNIGNTFLKVSKKSVFFFTLQLTPTRPDFWVTKNMFFTHFFNFRWVCLCWTKWIWASPYALINSINNRDHLLNVLLKLIWLFHFANDTNIAAQSENIFCTHVFCAAMLRPSAK